MPCKMYMTPFRLFYSPCRRYWQQMFRSYKSPLGEDIQNWIVVKPYSEFWFVCMAYAVENKNLILIRLDFHAQWTNADVERFEYTQNINFPLIASCLFVASILLNLNYWFVADLFNFKFLVFLLNFAMHYNISFTFNL